MAKDKNTLTPTEFVDKKTKDTFDFSRFDKFGNINWEKPLPGGGGVLPGGGGDIPSNNEEPEVTPNEENALTWIDGRSAGMQMFGSVRATYANIYTPSETSITRLFSLQAKQFNGAYVIEDCGGNELSDEATQAYFGFACPRSDADFLDVKTLHIGKLTDEALAYVRECTGGQPTTPYVLYDPRMFTWEICTKKIQLYSPEKKKKFGIAALLAAAGLLWN